MIKVMTCLKLTNLIPCPPSPADAPKIAKIAGTFITATFTPGRSPSGSSNHR
jgi:hypothetical protein